MGRKPKAVTFSQTPMHENTALMKTETIPEDKGVLVRRSGRLQSVFRLSQKQENQQIMGPQFHIVASENENEQQNAAVTKDITPDDKKDYEKEVEICEDREVEVHVEQEEAEKSDNGHTPEPTPIKNSLEDKIDRLVETVEQLKDQVTEIHPSSDLMYKNLYADAKKEIAALTDENHKLNEKLKVTLYKLEAHQGVKEVYDKLMINLTKANEAFLSLSSKAAAKAKKPRVYKKRKGIEASSNLNPPAALATSSPPAADAAASTQAKVHRRNDTKAKK